MVKLLVGTSKFNLNFKESDGSTPLLLAAEESHKAMVKLLEPQMHHL
jgi:ankyrin repeat protein